MQLWKNTVFVVSFVKVEVQNKKYIEKTDSEPRPVLKLFLFFGHFEPRCSYKIVNNTHNSLKLISEAEH